MARKKGCTVEVREGHHIVFMGDMEIWDGADLALLRETLARLADQERRKSIGVDLSFVKYIPSGFFGMLFDYAERGLSVRVLQPQPHVRQMLWFREFFDLVGNDVFKLALKPHSTTAAAERHIASTKAPWVEDSVPMPAAQTSANLEAVMSH